jgi:hypothetical protein
MELAEMGNSRADKSCLEINIVDSLETPLEVKHETPSSPEPDDLDRLENASWWFLMLAGWQGGWKGGFRYLTPEFIAYLVGMSAKIDLSRWPRLYLSASLGSGMPYGILNDPKDLETLLRLSAGGKYISLDDASRIDSFLKTRAKALVADIKRKLGIGAGRPRNSSKHAMWSFGAELREAGYSWRKIARRLDPEGYAADHKAATDRMRLGITALLRKLERKPPRGK